MENSFSRRHQYRQHDILTTIDDGRSTLDATSDFDHTHETDSQRFDLTDRRRESCRRLSCSIQGFSSVDTFLLDEDEIPTRDAGLDLSFSNNASSSVRPRDECDSLTTIGDTPHDDDEGPSKDDQNQPSSSRKKRAKGKRGREGERSRNNNSLNFREKLERLEKGEMEEEETKASDCGDLPIDHRPSCWEMDNPYQLTVTPHNVDTLLISARFYNQGDVIGLCKNVLLHCDVQNALYYRFVAEKHQLVDIAPFLQDYVRANFLSIVNTHSFLGMNLTQLKTLLTDDGLQVHSELDVFQAARAWIDHSKHNRIKQVGEVMACVRFNHITPQDIVCHVEPHKTYFKGPGGREVLLSIYRYHALSSSRGDLSAVQMEMPPPRTYIPLGMTCSPLNSRAPSQSELHTPWSAISVPNQSQDKPGTSGHILTAAASSVSATGGNTGAVPSQPSVISGISSQHEARALSTQETAERSEHLSRTGQQSRQSPSRTASQLMSDRQSLPDHVSDTVTLTQNTYPSTVPSARSVSANVSGSVQPVPSTLGQNMAQQNSKQSGSANVSWQMQQTPSVHNQTIAEQKSKEAIAGQSEGHRSSFMYSEQPTAAAGPGLQPTPSQQLPSGSLSKGPCSASNILGADRSQGLSQFNVPSTYVTSPSTASLMPVDKQQGSQQTSQHQAPSSQSGCFLTVPVTGACLVTQGVDTLASTMSQHNGFRREDCAVNQTAHATPSTGFQQPPDLDRTASATAQQQSKGAAGITGRTASRISWFGVPSPQTSSSVSPPSAAPALPTVIVQSIPAEQTAGGVPSQSQTKKVYISRLNFTPTAPVSASQSRASTLHTLHTEHQDSEVPMSSPSPSPLAAPSSKSRLEQMASSNSMTNSRIAHNLTKQNLSKMSMQNTEGQNEQQEVSTGNCSMGSVSRGKAVSQTPSKSCGGYSQRDVEHVPTGQALQLTNSQLYGYSQLSATAVDVPLTNDPAASLQQTPSKSIVAERLRSFEALQAQKLNELMNCQIGKAASRSKRSQGQGQDNTRQQTILGQRSDQRTDNWSRDNEDITAIADGFSDYQLEELERHIKQRRKEIARRKREDMCCRKSPLIGAAVQTVTSVKIHCCGSPQPSPYASPSCLNVARCPHRLLQISSEEDYDNTNSSYSPLRPRQAQRVNAAGGDMVMFQSEEENTLRTYPTSGRDGSLAKDTSRCQQEWQEQQLKQLQCPHHQQQQQTYSHPGRQQYAIHQEVNGGLQKHVHSQKQKGRKRQDTRQPFCETYPTNNNMTQDFHNQREQNSNNPEYRPYCQIRQTHQRTAQEPCQLTAQAHINGNLQMSPGCQAEHKGTHNQAEFLGQSAHKQQLDEQTSQNPTQDHPRRHRSQSPTRSGPWQKPTVPARHQSQPPPARAVRGQPNDYFNDNASDSYCMTEMYGQGLGGLGAISDDNRSCLASNQPISSGMIYEHHPYTTHGKHQMSMEPGEALIVAVGGLNPQDLDEEIPCRLIDLYNPGDNDWSLLGKLPEARHHHGCVMLDGYLYVIGGSMVMEEDLLNMSIATNSCYRYDFGGNFWTVIAPMRRPRMYHGVAVLEGVIYAMGGETTASPKTGTCFLDSCEYYNPDTDEWGPIANMLDESIGTAVIGFHGFLWVIGGFLEHGQENIVLATVDCYDPRTNSWITKNHLPTSVCHASVAEVMGSLFLVGGANVMSRGDPVVSQDHIMQYLEDDDTWVTFNKLSVPRHDASCCVIGSRLYVLGGVCSIVKEVLDSVECYDVATEKHYEDLKVLPSPALGLSCVAIMPEHFDQ